MADERPLCGAEEWVNFDIGGSSASPQSAILILDQELSNKRLAKTGCQSVYEDVGNMRVAYFEICGDPVWSGKGISSLRMFAKVAFRFLPLNGVVP